MFCSVDNKYRNLFLCQSLINFVNKHLNKINLEVTDLDSQVNSMLFYCL